MKKRAITFGTFDLLHYGHMRFLVKIASMAKEVYVGLASDEIIFLNKKVMPVYNYELRREMLLHTRYVNTVLCHSGPVDGKGRFLIVAQKIKFIKDYGIDLVVMGSDWQGEYSFLEPHCEVRYLERTPDISTSQLRQSLSFLPKLQNKIVK